MVGEEVIDELSRMELLPTVLSDDADFGPDNGADLLPTKLSDILGGKTGATFPDGDSKFCVESSHLQPVAVHLWYIDWVTFAQPFKGR